MIRSKRLPEDEACRYFRQVVNAVHYCHERRVCHRDLKLENVLLDGRGGVKIIDFGLSNVLSADYKLKTACGSPSYASPEMLSQKKYYGPMVDVWALGVMLYAMLCGYLPFDDQNLQNLYHKITSGQYKKPQVLSERALDLIQRILVVDPEQRIDLAGIMRHPWYREASPDPVPPPHPVEPQTRIDFAVVRTMVQTMREWDVGKIVKALSGNRHNSMSATYYLLCDKKQRLGRAEWDYAEQARHARALGLLLEPDGSLRAADGGALPDDAPPEQMSAVQNVEAQSEVTHRGTDDEEAGK